MSGPPEGPQLRAVLALGAGEVLALARAPRGPGVPVRDVVLLDEEDLPRAAGCVVLAVGVDPASERAPAAVAAAARAGAVAVALRPLPDGGVAPAVLAAAEGAGLAVLVRAAGVDWAQVAGALRTAVAGATGGGADAGPRLGDLPALAALVAELTGGAVVIEDNASRVLAHSRTGMDADEIRRRTILGGRVPAWRVDELRRSGLFRAVLAAPGVVHRPADGAGNPERMVVAVRAGTEILGSLWLAPEGGPLPERARSGLERAALVAVPHLMYHRLRDHAAVARREGALRELLLGRGDPAAHALALDVPPGRPCAVLVVVPAVPGAEAARTLGVLAAQAEADRRPVVVLREQGRVAVLLAGADGGAPDAVGLGGRLARLAGALPGGQDVLVGVGPVVGGVEGAAGSFAVAGRVVRVLRGRYRAGGGSRCAGPQEVAAAVTLLGMLDAAEPVWRAGGGPVHELVERERREGGELLPTLTAWLDAFGDTAAAARTLGVHVNTVRYRLRRVRERFGVDLTDPEVRLLVMLALRLPPDGG